MRSDDGIPRRLPCRAGKLTGLLGRRVVRHSSTHVANLFRGRTRGHELVERRHRETAGYLAGTLGELRGGAAKLGQLASFLELDFLPEEYRELYRNELATLRDSAPAMDWPTVRRVLEEEWASAPESVLEQLEQTPAAAASIGQVHRGMTRDGRQVAIKVQYPAIADAMSAEVRSVARLLGLARGLAPALDVKAVRAEFRERLLEELDYELEGRHQAAFARAYRGHPFIHVPDTDTALTRRRVLVTDWVDGLRFDAVLALPQTERDRFGEILFRFYLGAVGVVGRFNSDPHPGNYLLRADGSVAFVDFGSVKAPDPAFVAGMGRLLRAGMASDAVEVRDAMAALGFLRRPELVEPELALRWLEVSSGWMLQEGPFTIDADVARPQLPLARDGNFRLARSLPDVDLPPDELLFGRLRVSLIAVLARLRAGADWQAIAREWWLHDPPRSELGRAEWAFLSQQPLAYQPAGQSGS